MSVKEAIMNQANRQPGGETPPASDSVKEISLTTPKTEEGVVSATSKETTPAVAASGTGAAPVASVPTPGAPVVPGGAPADDYKPSYKFKAWQKEHEFPDWAKPLVTKETETHLKELFQKAYGLDELKPRSQKREEEFKDISTKFAGREQQIQKISKMFQAGDLDGGFSALQIPDEMVLKQAKAILDRADAPPEHQAAWRQGQDERRRAQALEEENTSIRGTLEQTIRQQYDLEINFTLNQPQFKSYVDAFDARLGKAGAFRDEVINRGWMLEQTTGKSVPVQQVVEEVARLLGYTPGAPGVAPQVPVMSPPGVGTPMAPQVPQSLPVIPNVRAQSGSPAAKPVQRLADLKAAYNKL